MSEPRPFHRLFGLSWIDFFRGSAIDVETELDLSLKQQFLDLVLIRKGPGPIPRRLPDGFEELAAHNLVTFKSFQEAFDVWALWELIGHYVNYRKQSSPSLQNLLPESEYRLFAVCARFPQQLAQQLVLTPLEAGVYEVRLGTLAIRVIVVNQLPEEEHNAMLHLFSAREDQLRYGEEPDMSDDKLKEFVRHSVDELLKSLPAEERVKGLSAEERLKGLPAEERLKGLPAEERLKGLPAEERLKGLPADEVARALSPEVLAALARLKANGSSAKP